MTKVWHDFGESMLFRQTLFAKTLKFFISVMAFKEIHQTLLIQTDFLPNSPNISHAKFSLFTVLCLIFKIRIKLQSHFHTFM